MADPTPDQTPERRPRTSVSVPDVARKKQRRISWIWLVPVVAALAGLSLVVKTWMQAGPEITIQFDTAEGLEVGKTQVRYKDVVIGVVKGVGFNEDRSKVIVEAALSKDVADLAREGTNFWVVRPRLGFTGVSGLGTLLSGAYIGVDAPEGEGRNGGKPQKLAFVGLETPPAVTHDRSGKRFLLKASNLGSLDIGSPVYFRRISVGRVVGYALDESGKAVNIEVFIDAPNDKFVTKGTRFWNASGVDVSVNADGLKMRTQSLVSLAIGGIAFENVSARASDEPAVADSHFDLYPGEADAKVNPDSEPFRIRMRFDQSVRGLSVGAPVDFQGITLGDVTAITIDFDTEKKRFFAIADATLYPERLGPVYDKLQAATDGNQFAGFKLMGTMIKHGLRAQLRSANLLTGQLYVVLDTFPNAKPVEFHPSDPAVIPTVPGQLDQLQEQIGNIVTKIEKIPFEQIGKELRNTLASTSSLMNQIDRQLAPDARNVLKQAQQSLQRVDQMLAPDASIPVNADRAMQELARAARSLRALSEFLQTNPESLLRGRGEDPIPGAGPVRN